MRALRIARQAYADIDAIAEFIQRDNPARAETFANEIAEWMRGLRSAVYGRYLILFQCDDEEVAILRVLHGARDIAGMFKGDED